MKKNTKKNTIVITLSFFILLVLFVLLYLWKKNTLYKSLAITSGTFFYHFFMRQMVGLVINAIFHNKMNYKARFFKERKGEKGLYNILKVKKWKGKIPSYSPNSFDPRKHDWEYIVMASCQAELVHVIIAILSLLPIFMGCVFGTWPVFIITSVLASLFDCVFIILQRYNRPRMLKLLKK